MKRRAFVMKVKPGCEQEYRKRHDEIWPELLEAFRNAGIADYAIFLDERTRMLVGIQTLEESQSLELLRGSELMKKWWAHMQDIMETNPDGSAVSHPLTEVFSFSTSSVVVLPGE